MNQWGNKEGRQVIQQRKQTLINRISPICFQLNAKKIFTDSQHRLQMEKRLYFLKQCIKNKNHTLSGKIPGTLIAMRAGPMHQLFLFINLTDPLKTKIGLPVM
jgi:hypothetical protein